MKKDIFIDAQIANRFAKTQDANENELIDWLRKYDEKKPEENAYLVTNHKLETEYIGGNMACTHPRSIWGIMIHMKQHGDRIVKKTTQEIDEFHIEHKSRIDRMRFTWKDKRFHLPTILISDRKIAVIEDNNFRSAVKDFPKYKTHVKVCKCCSELTDYK